MMIQCDTTLTIGVDTSNTILSILFFSLLFLFLISAVFVPLLPFHPVERGESVVVGSIVNNTGASLVN